MCVFVTEQMLAEAVNRALALHCRPATVFGVVGLTWTDLYPSPRQNFVLGQALAEVRCATLSFGRFELNRGSDTEQSHVDITQVDATLIWKMFKVPFLL